MKQLKMLGLGVSAVLLLAALSGAPSAMAVGTELCKADEATCKEANAITTVHEVTPETKKATLLTSSGNVECNVLFSGEIPDDATNGSAYVNGNFTYTGCLFKGAACEVKEASKSSLLTIARTEISETASAKVTGQISVSCGLSISCTFTEEKLAGTAKGALASTLKNGEVSFKEAVIKTSSDLCARQKRN